MTHKSKRQKIKINVPCDLFGVYATLLRGQSEDDFNSIFSKSKLYIQSMSAHWHLARSTAMH